MPKSRVRDQSLVKPPVRRQRPVRGSYWARMSWSPPWAPSTVTDPWKELAIWKEGGWASTAPAPPDARISAAHRAAVPRRILSPVPGGLTRPVSLSIRARSFLFLSFGRLCRSSGRPGLSFGHLCRSFGRLPLCRRGRRPGRAGRRQPRASRPSQLLVIVAVGMEISS